MSLTPAQAAQLRGQAGWAGSLMHGKFGRLALNFLKTRQYQHEESAQVSRHQLRELQLLARLVQHAPVRCVSVVGRPDMPVVVYSDASFEQSKAVCGWAVFDGSRTPIGPNIHVHQEWIAAWQPRDTQIFVQRLSVPFSCLSTSQKACAIEMYSGLWIMKQLLRPLYEGPVLLLTWTRLSS